MIIVPFAEEGKLLNAGVFSLELIAFDRSFSEQKQIDCFFPFIRSL